MRKLIFILPLLCGSFVAAPAKAEPAYRWCAQVGSDAKPSCYFATFEKCRSYIMAAGGVCFSRVLADEPEVTASRTTNAMSAARATR
jgi:ABC-type tungstate transport system substrate-binding protein